MTYTMIVIAAEAPTLINEWPANVEITWYKFNLQTIVGWSIFTFAFCCHANVFPVKAELQYPVLDRYNKVANRVVTALLVIYTLVSVTGYLSIPEDTPKIFVNRIATIGWKDIWMTISKGMMIINLLIAIPLNLNPCRLEVMILLGKDKNASTFLHALVTILILFGSAGIAMLIPDIVQAIGIIGGICSTALSYTFPAMMYLTVSNLPKMHCKRILVWVLGGITTIAGFTSAVIVTLQLTGVIENEG